MIELDAVGHSYRTRFGRPVRALDDVSLRVAAGEVFGIAGPNGAGKSTLIALVLGFLEPTAGSVRVGGLRPREFAERRGVGYLSELVAVPSQWKARDALRRYATLGGAPPSAIRGEVDAAVERFELGEHAGKRMAALSKGTGQRLALAQAVMQRAALLVLDEPTHGLDPLWSTRLRTTVAALRRPDRAILVTSHDLGELEALCDRVAIVNRGRVDRVVSPRAPAAAGTVVYRLVVAGADAARLAELFPGAESRGGGEFVVRADGTAALSHAVGALIAGGAELLELAPLESALEREFRDAVEGRA